MVTKESKTSTVFLLQELDFNEIFLFKTLKKAKIYALENFGVDDWVENEDKLKSDTFVISKINIR